MIKLMIKLKDLDNVDVLKCFRCGELRKSGDSQRSRVCADRGRFAFCVVQASRACMGLLWTAHF